MPILIRYNDNYADEFDVEGFFALSDEDWKAYKAKIKKVIGDNYFTFNIGTNEEIVEGNSWHDLFFGKCSCEKHVGEGQNNLGKIIMKVRQELKENNT